MSSLFTVDVDSTPLIQAFDMLPPTLQLAVNAAAGVTAHAIVREAAARLRRQLGPNAIGETAAHIVAQPAFDGHGWVVLADNPRMPNLPLWLEKGTQPGKRHNFARTHPRPFYYASIELEAGPHERRVSDAMEESADASGLGG